jgi:hypothetical protein
MKHTKPGALHRSAKVKQTVSHPKPSTSAATGLEPAAKGSRIAMVGGVITVQVEKSLDEVLANLPRLAGTASPEAAFRIIGQVAGGLGGFAQDPEGGLMMAASLLAELAPKSLLEAQLCSQILATHEAVLRCLNAAGREGQTQEGADSNIARANRLGRLHLEQIEALRRLRGESGTQKMTVEHITVEAGGRAVVGFVEAPKGNKGGGGR